MTPPKTCNLGVGNTARYVRLSFFIILSYSIIA